MNLTKVNETKLGIPVNLRIKLRFLYTNLRKFFNIFWPSTQDEYVSKNSRTMRNLLNKEPAYSYRHGVTKLSLIEFIDND